MLQELERASDRSQVQDRVVSEVDAAHYLGCSPDTLRRMHNRGEGPRRLKISPRRVGYRLSDINTWLDARASR